MIDTEYRRGTRMIERRVVRLLKMTIKAKEDAVRLAWDEDLSTHRADRAFYRAIRADWLEAALMEEVS